MQNKKLGIYFLGAIYLRFKVSWASRGQGAQLGVVGQSAGDEKKEIAEGRMVSKSSGIQQTTWGRSQRTRVGQMQENRKQSLEQGISSAGQCYHSGKWTIWL